MTKTTYVDEVAFSKLQIRQSDPKEEPIKVTDSIIPPPLTEMLEDTAGKNDSKELTEVERKLQQGQGELQVMLLSIYGTAQ